MATSSSAIDRTAKALQNLRPDFTLSNARTFAERVASAPSGIFGEKPLAYLPGQSSLPAHSSHTRRDATSSAGEVLTGLDNQVGLADAKHQLRVLDAELRLAKYYREAGIDNPAVRTPRHFLFDGPPGTGKTTTARRLQQLLYFHEVVPEAKLVEVSAYHLRGQAVGQAEQATVEALKQADGGVLYLEGAGDLVGRHGQSDVFGRQVVETILLEMENNSQLSVIFEIGAGLADRFAEAFPGVMSRVHSRIRFESYSAHELTRIVETMARESNPSHSFEPAALEYFEERAAVLETKSGGHRLGDVAGNGRMARNFLDGCRRALALRLADDLRDGSLTLDAATTIQLEDAREALELLLSGLNS